MTDFQWRESVHVHPWHGFLHRADDTQVGLPREARMNASLQADLGRTGRRSLDRAARDLVELEVISRSAQIRGPAALRKRTETAVVQADVGVVDIPVYDVGDRVADRFLAQLIRRGDDLIEVAAFHAEETHDVCLVQRMSSACRVDERCCFPATASAGDCGRPAGRPTLRDRGQRRPRARKPTIRPRKPATVARPPHARRDPRIRPDLGPRRVSRRERQTLHQVSPGRVGTARKILQVRPRRLRIDMIRRHRRHPTPVVDSSPHQAGQPLGLQVGRRLNRHPGPKQQPRHRNRPQLLLEIRLGSLGHPGPRLRPEILDNQLLQMPVRIVELTQRQQRLNALAPRLANTNEQPRSHGDAQLARRPQRRKAPLRALVRRPEMGPPSLAQPLRGTLQHQTHRHADGPKLLQIPGVHDPRVEMGQ